MASTAERNERRPSKAGPSRPERERALDPGIKQSSRERHVWRNKRGGLDSVRSSEKRGAAKDGGESHA